MKLEIEKIAKSDHSASVPGTGYTVVKIDDEPVGWLESVHLNFGLGEQYANLIFRDQASGETISREFVLDEGISSFLGQFKNTAEV